MTTLGVSSASNSAVNYLDQSNKTLYKTLLELASDSNQSDPSDDAAGVAVSGTLTARLDQLQSATNGASDTVSLAQTADGFLSTIQDQLDRLGTLAISANDGALGSSAQADYSTEFNDILGQVSAVAANANFDGISLFSNQTISAAVNADGTTSDLVLSTLGSAASLGLSGASIATPAQAGQAVALINSALGQVTNRRAELNADISTLNFYASNNQTEEVNTAAANSRISDVNIATASTQRAQSSIQSDAATSVLAQANADRRSVLALLS